MTIFEEQLTDAVKSRDALRVAKLLKLAITIDDKHYLLFQENYPIFLAAVGMGNPEVVKSFLYYAK